MAWESERYWINGNDGIGFSFGPYNPLPLLVLSARPEIFPTKLKTEPLSAFNNQGPTGDISWVVFSVVTNQTNGSAWFRWVGTEVS